MSVPTVREDDEGSGIDRGEGFSNENPILIQVRIHTDRSSRTGTLLGIFPNFSALDPGPAPASCGERGRVAIPLTNPGPLDVRVLSLKRGSLESPSSMSERPSGRASDTSETQNIVLGHSFTDHSTPRHEAESGLGNAWANTGSKERGRRSQGPDHRVGVRP